MNIISHFVYPALFAQSANILYRHKQEKPLFNKKQLLLIGVCGALPDILSPHLGLQARYHSFWHSLWFLLLIAAAATVLIRKYPLQRRLVIFCAFATAFHLFCDLIAGGINLYGPFGKFVIGKYWIPFQYWIPVDIAGVLFLLVACIYSASSVRARPLILSSGFILAVCGAGLAFTAFDLEAFLTRKIPASEISRAQQDEAQRAWVALVAKWQKGTYEPVSDGFAANMKEGLSPKLQKQFYEQMRQAYGEYRGLTLVEVVAARFYFPRLTAYRFRGHFSKTTHQPEIDIVFDRDGKVSRILFRDNWKAKIL